MYWSGFADEAADGIDGQIAATRALGWNCIEARNVDGVNIHDMPEAAFARAAARLAEAGVRVDCFGSTIANWGKRIDDPADASLDEARRAVARMKRLGTRMVRVMSYAVRRNQADQMEAERFRRLREIVRLFTDAGMTAVHENCANYGGMSWAHALRLLENVPGLKLCFDTGNPVGSRDYGSTQPDARQSPWEFYAHVREHVARVHIKDRRFVSFGEGLFPNAEHCYPGEGEGDVRRIVADLVARGYDACISIEPHMGAVYHDKTQASAQARFEIYVEYGRRMMRMVEELCQTTVDSGQ